MTGRPRRCGWLDLPLLRYAGMINGISWLVVTKLDVLDELAEIPVCVGYKINGKVTAEIPAHASGYDAIECVYQNHAGLADFHPGHHATGKVAARRRGSIWISREGKRRPGRHGLHRARSASRPCLWTSFTAELNGLTGQKTGASATI